MPLASIQIISPLLTSACANPILVIYPVGKTIAFSLHLNAQNLLIKGNRFVPDSSGGMAHEWLGSSSTASNYRVTIVDNYFEGAHDHAIYCSGLFKSVIANNRAENTGSTAIKTIGSKNVIVNNQIYISCSTNHLTKMLIFLFAFDTT